MAEKRGRRVAPLCGLAVALVALACGPAEVAPQAPETSAPLAATEQPSSPSPRIVLLISIDTLRADHLGLYGYDRFTSPTLDMLGAAGTVFDDASAPAPWTLPSHTTMLTGLTPRTHHVVTFSTALDPATPTLPGLLRERGWKTAAAVSTSWLRRERYNVTKDFEHYIYVETKPWRRSPNTWITDRATEWITESPDEPIFLFLHYFDVHGDYVSESGYESMFVKPYDGPADGTSWQLLMSYLEPEYIEMCKKNFDREKCGFGKGDGEKLLDADFVRPVFEARDIEHLKDLYDAGIRQMDTEISRLLAFLRKQGLDDETLVIVTSDHGEEFMEHGRLDHFMSPHQEVLHVPLLLRGPGIPSGLRIDAPVSLVDLVPTILDLTGLPPHEPTEGRSLVPLIEGASDAPFRTRALFGEAPGGLTYENITPGIFPVIRTIRRDNWKLVYDSKQDAYALYDLSTDPLERVDLSGEKSALAAALAEEMARRYEGFTPDTLENAKVELSDEEIEELRALGYVP